MSTRIAESPECSPDLDGSGEKRVSKKRKVLSCYACRSRKMKCDRVYPVCGRCQRTGRSDQCTYDPRLLEELDASGEGHVDGAPHGTHTASTARNPLPADWAQQRRLGIVERKPASLNDRQHPAFDTLSRIEDAEPQGPHFKEEIMFRGKGFKTSYQGSTSPLSALTQFAELHAFTRIAMMSSGSLRRSRHDFKSFRKRRKALMKERASVSRGADDEVRALVPEKNLLDAQLALYFRTWETTYRILHEPTFWKGYQTFWERGSTQEVTTTFAATLVYISAIVSCLTAKDDNQFVGDSSADREEAFRLVNGCDAWLQRQPRKRLTLSVFQLQCVSLLAKRGNCIQLKQDWISTGDVLRLALSAGLHRNPSLIVGGKISEYEKEMRRRLWVTIVELEVQSSIDSGFQSSATGLDFDVQAPANLPDKAFSEETLELPAGRPIHHFTPSSYLQITLQSLPFRLHLAQILNSRSSDLRYYDIIDYDAKIHSLLSSLPNWHDSEADLSISLLKLQLLQFLLILHRPYANLATRNRQYRNSFVACVDAASSMLTVHETLIAKNILALHHHRSDILRTGITLAQTIYYNCCFAQEVESSSMPTPSTASIHAMDVSGIAEGNQTTPHTQLPKIPHLPKEDFLATTLCTTAITLLEKVGQLFERKVMRLGTAYVEYWLVSSAIGMMPKKDQPPTSVATITNTMSDDVHSRARKALEQMTTLLFRVLANQKDSDNTFASSLRTSIGVASPLAPLSNVNTGDLSRPDSVIPGNTSQPGEEDSIPLIRPYMNGMVGTLADTNGHEDAFEGLEDLQMDLSGWNFPEFWNFDALGQL